MWQWSDKLKLGKSSPFVKRDLRVLSLTDAEFEADFFLDRPPSHKRPERWMGIVVERESGGLLALEDVAWPPPTVNDFANLLSHAMARPLTGAERQRPATVHLRDRPQWQELLPHLRELGVEIVFHDDLPWFDEAAVEWMRQTAGKNHPSVPEIKTRLRKPFPARKQTWFTDALALMEWTDAMSKRAYPSRKIPVPPYGPTTLVSIQLTSEELEMILTSTEITKTEKLRPRFEAMAVKGRAVEFDIDEWSRVLLTLCGKEARGISTPKDAIRTARRIANKLAEALNIDPPVLRP